MAISYTEQPDGSLLGVEDDVLITLRPLGGNNYAYEVWIDDEVPAYRGEANGRRQPNPGCRTGSTEALLSRDPEG